MGIRLGKYFFARRGRSSSSSSEESKKEDSAEEDAGSMHEIQPELSEESTPPDEDSGFGAYFS